MQFTFFEIENFRGIQLARLDLGASPHSHIYTLVGLNESGKTTVLEAINHFAYKNETLDPLELPGYTIKDIHSLIPIGQRANFNGLTSLKFGLELDDNDENKIADYMAELGFTLEKKIEKLTVHRVIGFKDSKYDAKLSTNYWYISLQGKKKHSKKTVTLTATDKDLIWQKTVKFIMGLMPSVLYFPNFLFEFPDRIYLEDDTGKKSEKAEFYRLVIQDILDALNKNLCLKTHILERAKSGDKNDQSSLDTLLLEMGRNVTDIVFGAWNKIFHQNIGHKKISLRCLSDDENKYYLEFKLEDTDGYFLINERSLGFRWFFVFLLLTQYRGFRKDSPSNVLFLFDEPASNLHPSAQTQLLNSFEKLSKKCRIIYTTHSHHLVNPAWLESAFVVKNEGLTYGNEELNYNANKTNITTTKYREFAVNHPDQTDYYRPILDVLDYVPSHFDNIPNVIMVEGKNDFYVISYLQFLIKKPKSKLNILPGTGSGNLESIIRLYTAWGRQFLVLLDADNEGKKQKKRYQGIFETILENRIFTLLDIDDRWDGFEMESLLSNDDKLLIQKSIYHEVDVFNKTHFNRAIQELLIKKVEISVSDETKKNFNNLIAFLVNKLKENDGK